MTLTMLDREEALAPDVLARMTPLWLAADRALRRDPHVLADIAELARDAVAAAEREAEARARREEQEAAAHAVRDAARAERERARDDRRAERERVIEERREARARLRAERRAERAPRGPRPVLSPEERAERKLAAQRAQRAARSPEEVAADAARRRELRAARSPEVIEAERRRASERAREKYANDTEYRDAAIARSKARHAAKRAARVAPDLDALIAAGEV